LNTIKFIEGELKLSNLSEELLSVDGVRKYINDINLPYINKYIKQFMELFEMNIPIKLDNTFTEEIDERNRGATKYGQCSRGERFSINMSILLSFLSLIQKQNSIDINFVWIDEADSLGFDQNRKDIFFNIFKNVINKKVFAISHDPEMKSHFGNSVEVKKVNRFSKLYWS
jgi:DNA repair exonuclease SbcCD ATPase subunit